MDEVIFRSGWKAETGVLPLSVLHYSQFHWNIHATNKANLRKGERRSDCGPQKPRADLKRRHLPKPLWSDVRSAVTLDEHLRSANCICLSMLAGTFLFSHKIKTCTLQRRTMNRKKRIITIIYDNTYNTYKATPLYRPSADVQINPWLLCLSPV